LRALGLPEARARAIRDFARAYADERIRLDPAAPFEATIEALEALPGIGPWTAHVIALRACGQQDAFPSGDLGLRRTAARLTGVDEPLPAGDVEAIAEVWRPHRALAAMHLWMAG
ncbi:MAG: DNA-3-methyladenine glycosylase 2 family protein, partial [Dehalococcoidia bacterium]